MPKAGLEPARLAAPPPQDGVSANSTTSARSKIFFELTPASVLPACFAVAGLARAAAGLARAVAAVAVVEPAV
jgi:hypothetical protein